MNMKPIKFAFLLMMISVLSACLRTTYDFSSPPPVPADNEIVMTEGMKITATTVTGTITITAGKGLMRSYTWEGETRSLIMFPRKARWYGSMGVYDAAVGDIWQEHNGIRRGVVDEGQQHFDNEESALEWLKHRYECVYRDDGLVVCYSKTLGRRQLNVDVWQIYLGGTVPSKYQESVYDSYPEPMKTQYKNKSIYYVGGHKPAMLPGSRNEMIKVEYPSGTNASSGTLVTN